jgi:hypothetical protein
MGEPERRRRRLRPPHAPAAAETTDPAPAEDGPAAVEDVVTTPVEPPVAESGPIPAAAIPAAAIQGGPIQGGPIQGGPIQGGPVETAPMEDPVVADAGVAAAPAPAEEPARKGRPGFTGRPRGSGPDDREVERGLRGLVGSGSSQVNVGAALRARDAARPTEAQLEEAEQTLTIVRRNWTPREELPRNR